MLIEIYTYLQFLADMYIEPTPDGDAFAVLASQAAALIFDAQTVEAFDRANEEYEYWSKFKRRRLPEGLASEDAWSYLKFRRETGGVNLGISVLPHAYFFATDDIQERLHRLDGKIGGAVGFGEEVSPADERRYVVNALMEEAIASSQLEGASTAREVAKAMLRSKRAPRDESERMIANNYAAMQYVVERKDAKLTPAYLLELHGIATRGTLDDPTHEGAFRTGGVSVIDSVDGTVAHEAPPVRELPGLIEAICDFGNDVRRRPFIHPLAKAAILHFLLGYVHPFEDGNGRTARAVMYGYMTKREYWLTEYLTISKAIAKSRAGYDKAYLYTEHDGLDVTYFVRYMLKAMANAAEEFERYLNRQLRKRRLARDRMLSSGLNQRQSDVIDRLTRDPDRFFTVREVAERYGVTRQTARTDLQGLVGDGRLVETKQGRSAVFTAPAD